MRTPAQSARRVLRVLRILLVLRNLRGFRCRTMHLTIHLAQPRDAIGCRRMRGEQLLQRFLISGPDLRITARFSPETHSNMQRFLISGAKLGNRCRDCPGLALQRAAIPDFMESIWQSLQRRKVPPAVVIAATRSASDSNLRRRKEKWFRLQWS